MARREFSPGFRFSAFDVVVILAGIGGVAVAAVNGSAVAIEVTAFVVIHFFLFCNVFRVSRLTELIWSAVFVPLAVLTTYRDAPTWPVTFAAAAGVTVVLILFELRRPSYHGIGWRKVNPNLPRWWRENHPD